MSLRDANFGKPWCEWTYGVDARRFPTSAGDELEEVRQFHCALQFLFFRQWQRLRQAAHERGVLLIGDVPIYVSYDCADVWSHRDLFQLDDNGRPTHVAGVPPDYFSATGQLWNNPLYNWEALKRTGYRWWIQRMQATLAEVDLVRLDHFRGFEAYWSVPFGEPTAENGEWIPGPGADFLQTLADHLAPSLAAASLVQGLPVIAEDLGMITEPVHALRRQFGLPGMNVLQFILPGEPDDPPDVQAFEPNSVTYTGTHDNDTTLGWFRTDIMTDADKWRRLRLWTPSREESIAWEFVTLAWQSSSRLAVAPVQDVLGLGTEARMNTPGTFGDQYPNWQWRLATKQLSERLAQDLADLTLATGRAGS
jgi:4-alpha-glucanotransferase